MLGCPLLTLYPKLTPLSPPKKRKHIKENCHWGWEKWGRAFCSKQQRADGWQPQTSASLQGRIHRLPSTRNNRQPRNRSTNQSSTLTENNNVSCQQAWGPGRAEVEVLVTGGLTQNMMLNPKIKYLMQQLTSWALKCFPDIIWLDFRL